MRDAAAHPARDVFGRGVEREDIVQVLMVQLVGNQPLDMAEVRHHAILVEYFRPAINRDNPVVPVQVRAFAFVGKAQAVRGRYF